MKELREEAACQTQYSAWRVESVKDELAVKQEKGEILHFLKEILLPESQNYPHNQGQKEGYVSEIFLSGLL